MQGRRLDYVQERASIRDGDVLLWKGSSWVSSLIRWAGRSPYSHAGLAVWIRGRLMVAESREGKGIRVLPLSSAVAGAAVDLYGVKTSLQTSDEPGPIRERVILRALELLGQPYGWRRIFLLGLARIPLLGRLVWATKAWSSDDERVVEGSLGLVCSAYVALCWHMAGLDLVPNMADASTEPGDLARSGLLELRGRLALD